MRTERKIVLYCGVYLLLSIGSLLLPHRPLPWISTIHNVLDVLLGLICLFTVVHEKNRTKPIFVNFAVFFLFTIPARLSGFVGLFLFPSAPYAVVYYHQYVNKIGYPFLLIFALLYVAVDYFGRNLRISQKYLLTSGIVLAIVIPLYYPYFVDPLRLYNSPEYAEYTQWNRVYDEAKQKLNREPSDKELIDVFSEENYQPTLAYSASRAGEQLEKFKPYFGASNSTMLFWKPLNRNALLVNAFLLFVIASVFVLKFLRDYPHAAYVEKILQVFFVFCALNIVHYWGYTQSPSYEIYGSIFKVSQYLTIGTLLLMVYVFSMRLRFVLSAFGQYYERMIATDPDQVTRWRDEIDNAIFRYFFKGKKYLGRLASLQSTHVHTSNKQEHIP